MTALYFPVRWRVLFPAALVAASGLFGGSAVLGSPTACAVPHTPEYDDPGFQVCAREIDNAYLDGKLTAEQWDAELEKCCTDHGGLWTPTVFARCSAPAAIEPGLDRGTIDQPTEAAPQPPPPPPRLPVAPQPSVIATVTPQPPGPPPPTSTIFPPPPPVR